MFKMPTRSSNRASTEIQVKQSTQREKKDVPNILRCRAAAMARRSVAAVIQSRHFAGPSVAEIDAGLRTENSASEFSLQLLAD